MASQLVQSTEVSDPPEVVHSPPGAPKPPGPKTGMKLDQRALLCFYDEPTRPLSIQEVQRRLGVTYKPAYQTLNGLAARGVLVEERSGWARSFRADVASPTCFQEFVRIEWVRGDGLRQLLPEGAAERAGAFVRRCEEETTPLFIRTLNGGPEGPLSGLFVSIARPEERGDVVAIGQQTGFTVSVASLEAVRHILSHRPDLASQIVGGACLFGAESFVRERFRALNRQAGRPHF